MNLIKRYNVGKLIKTIKLLEKRSTIYMLSIFIFNVIEAVSVPLSAYGIKGVINAVTTSNATLFWKSIQLIAINNILWIVYSPISSYWCAWASKKALSDIKTQFVEHLIRLPQKYHDLKPTGEVLSLISNDVDCFQNIYDWDYFQVVRHAVVGIAGLITMLVIDWRFATIVFVLGTFSVYITSCFSKELEKTGVKLQEQLSKNSTDFYEMIKAIKSIRLLGISKKKAQSFDKETEYEANIRIKNCRINANMNSLITFINSLSYIVILIIGGVFVYLKLSDWGTVIALSALKGTADCLFSDCAMHMAKMQESLAGVKRVLEVMEESEEVVDTSKYYFTSQLKPSNSVLSLKDVNFSYDGKIDVLKSVNISLEVGKLTVLIGESGSGKSTLMKILMSLYQPTKGKIIFKDDNNLIIDREILRKKTAYVPQDPMLFEGSIYDNIACGNENATYNDIISAAKATGANDFITQMANGYNTKLNDDGKSLSGGQRQRIAIARALVKNAPILLLDEITSALDSENEAKILETICRLKVDKAILFISHKVDVEKYADVVMRINDGIVN